MRLASSPPLIRHRKTESANHRYGEEFFSKLLERWKRDYDALYVRQEFSQHDAYGVSFNEVLPVVACGAFTPEVYFNGRRLQKLGVGPAQYEATTFNLTVFDGRGVAVLGWMGKQDGPASLFAG